MPEKGPQFHTEKNGQMAFFRQDASMLSDKARYPRGYTPERYREVSDALDKTKTGTVDYVPTDDDYFYHLARGTNQDTNTHEESARIKETLARSTVPTSDLEGLRGIHTNASGLRPQISGKYHTKRNDRRGSIFLRGTLTGPVEHDYAGYDDSGYVEPFEYRDVDDINDNSATLIHELGHHVDNRSGRFKERALANDYSMSHRGEGEGRADAYADKHFVNDRRFPKAFDNRTEEGGYTSQAFRNLSEFWDSYSKHRGIKTKEQVNNSFQPPIPGVLISGFIKNSFKS